MADPILLAEMTWPEVEEATKDHKAVGLVPVGATEAHGPHLPLLTDTYIAIEMAKRGAAKLKAHGVRAFVLPSYSYSVADFGKDFPGTLSVSKEASVMFLRDIAASAAPWFRAVVFANMHLEPAHLDVLRRVCEEGKKSGVSTGFVDLTRKRWAAQLGEAFCAGDHAGAFETSAMMALNLKLVRERERISIPPMDGILVAMKKGATTFKDAGGDDAYFGDPGAASIEEGERLLEQLGEICCVSVMEHLAAKS
jgi:creatinine amidohydrolase